MLFASGLAKEVLVEAFNGLDGRTRAEHRFARAKLDEVTSKWLELDGERTKYRKLWWQNFL